MPSAVDNQESLVLVLVVDEVCKVFLKLRLCRPALFVVAQYSLTDTVIVSGLKYMTQPIDLNLG